MIRATFGLRGAGSLKSAALQSSLVSRLRGEDGRYWLDLVFADMEARDYAIAAFDFPACCVGAPHKRSRHWFVADSRTEPVRTPVGDERCGCWDRNAFHRTVGMLPGEQCANKPRTLGDSERHRAERIAGGEGRQESATPSARQSEGRGRLQAFDSSDVRVLGDAHSARLALRSLQQIGRGAVRHQGAAIGAAGATRGFWEQCEWIYHDDGVYRAVEPESFPLAPRLPGDMEQIHAYGNAIVPQVAQVFIEAYMSLSEAVA
jgi:DNA (cytosine-5)-methyltransferase 1